MGVDPPVNPESFLTKFRGLNRPDETVGVVKLEMALGVGSTPTPTLGMGVMEAAPDIGVSGELTEMSKSGGVVRARFGLLSAGSDGSRVRFSSVGSEDKGGVVSDASTNSSSSSEHSVSEDSLPKSSALNWFERTVPTPSVCSGKIQREKRRCWEERWERLPERQMREKGGSVFGAQHRSRQSPTNW